VSAPSFICGYPGVKLLRGAERTQSPDQSVAHRNEIIEAKNCAKLTPGVQWTAHPQSVRQSDRDDVFAL